MLSGLGLMFAAGVYLGWAQGPAPVIVLQVLDGLSGKPVSTETIQVSCLAGKDGCEGLDEFHRPPENPAGIWTLVVPANATELVVHSREDQYEFCGYELSDGRYDVGAIGRTGVLGKNTCGSPSAKSLKDWQPQPGRLVVFAHRKPWWRRIFPYC